MIAHGLGALTLDQLAEAATAGKASIYRRWPAGTADLVPDLIAASPVVQLAKPGMPAISQARALLDSWTAPLTHNEEVVGCALGTIGTYPRLSRILRARIDDDLEAWWNSLAIPSGMRSQECSPWVLRTLRALLVTRLSTGPLGVDLVAAVEQLLVGPLHRSRQS